MKQQRQGQVTGSFNDRPSWKKSACKKVCKHCSDFSAKKWPNKKTESSRNPKPRDPKPWVWHK